MRDLRTGWEAYLDEHMPAAGGALARVNPSRKSLSVRKAKCGSTMGLLQNAILKGYVLLIGILHIHMMVNCRAGGRSLSMKQNWRDVMGPCPSAQSESKSDTVIMLQVSVAMLCHGVAHAGHTGSLCAAPLLHDPVTFTPY
jgi:hypothetical protein